MKTLAIAAGLALFGAAATVNAQYYVYRDAPQTLSDNQECWNPHARHFERVRPGDYQPDLDFSRCRMIGEAYYAPRNEYARDECWNPHAGHFEAVRPGEYQGDLDFSRCRRIGEGAYNYYRYR